HFADINTCLEQLHRKCVPKLMRGAVNASGLENAPVHLVKGAHRSLWGCGPTREEIFRVVVLYGEQVMAKPGRDHVVDVYASLAAVRSDPKCLAVLYELIFGQANCVNQ